MKFILVRHPETEALKNKIIYGITESPLTPEGEATIPWAAERLRGIEAAEIYSSPLSRSYRLALGIAEGRGLEVLKDDRLKEMNCGIYENKTFEEAQLINQEDAQQYLLEFGTYRPEGGENFQDVKERVKPFLDELIAREGELGQKPVFIVSHSMVMRAIISHLSGFSLGELWHMYIAPTAIVSVDYNSEAQFGRIIGFTSPSSEI